MKRWKYELTPALESWAPYRNVLSLQIIPLYEQPVYETQIIREKQIKACFSLYESDDTTLACFSVVFELYPCFYISYVLVIWYFAVRACQAEANFSYHRYLPIAVFFFLFILAIWECNDKRKAYWGLCSLYESDDTTLAFYWDLWTEPLFSH